MDPDKWPRQVHGHTQITMAAIHAGFCFGKRKGSKTLSTSSLTINAPLIVKDEVDKVFELISSNKTKIYVYAYVHGHTRTHWPQSTQST